MFQAEVRIVRGDGTGLPVEATSSVFEDHDGSPRTSTILRDISDRVRAEEELRVAKEQAERASEAKSRFLSLVSHELRTPLASILGYGELLRDAGDLPGEKERGWVEHVVEAGRHLLDLVNDLLEVSRVEAGRVPIARGAVDVAAALRDVRDLVEPVAAESRVEVDVAATDGVTVLADGLRLRQALLNLVGSAVRLGRAGGRVGLAAAEAGDLVRITISSPGLTLERDRLDRIFEPFERPDLAGGDGLGFGTGLGLVVARGLVDAMQGSLGVESAAGPGTVFAVELPSGRDAAVATAPPEQRAGPVTILYVEDNPSNMQLLQAILEEMRPDLTLRIAETGEEGARLVSELRPDLLVLDLDLPDISGEEVLRRVRAEQATAALPVLVLSADSTSASMTRLLKAGADAYLTKPLDIAQFLDVADGLVERR